MIRRLALTTMFLAAGALPAFAQSTPSHASSHPHPACPHGPGHTPADSATHAALHARLGGAEAVMAAAHASNDPARMKAVHDSLMKTLSASDIEAAHQAMAAACAA